MASGGFRGGSSPGSPLLIVTARRDLPSSQAEGLKAALENGRVKFSSVQIDSDHVFDDRRIELETVVINWLSQLAEPTVPPKSL